MTTIASPTRIAQNEPSAQRRKVLFMLVDRTDGATPETGVSFGSSGIKISKLGGGTANFTGTVAEIDSGLYQYTFTSSEISALGRLGLLIDVAAARPIFIDIEVVTFEEQYDHLYDGAIWIDTVNGTAGAVLGVNGTKSNPVTNATDARTLADALDVQHYKILAATFGSPFSFSADHTDWFFEGVGSTTFGFRPFVFMGLGAGPNGVARSRFKGVSFTAPGGNFTNTSEGVSFEDCDLVDVANIDVDIFLRGDCFLFGELTFAGAGNILTNGKIVSVGGALIFNVGSTAQPEIRGAAGGWGFEINAAGVTVAIEFELPGAVEVEGTGGTIAIQNPRSVEADPAITTTIAPGAVLEALYPDQAIFVDVANGVAGAVVGINGTPANPVDNQTDARALADALGRRKYKLLGEDNLSITVDHVGWTFEADSFLTSISFLSGVDIDGVVIRNLQVAGVLGAGLPLGLLLEDCFVGDISYSGLLVAKACLVGGTITFLPVKFLNAIILRDCTFFDAGAGVAGVDVDDNAGIVFAFNLAGEMFLRNSSSASVDNFFFLNGGKVILESTASAGKAFISGVGTFDRQGAIAVDSEGLIDQADPLVRGTSVLDADASNVLISSSVPAGTYNGYRCIVESVSGATIEEKIIKEHTRPTPGDDVANLELETPLSFVPALGDPVSIRPSPQVPLPLANTFQDMEIYVADGDSKVLTSARIRVFPTAALAAAATKNAVGLEGAIAVFTWTAVKGTSPGEPEQARMVNTTP